MAMAMASASGDIGACQGPKPAAVSCCSNRIFRFLIPVPLKGRFSSSVAVKISRAASPIKVKGEGSSETDTVPTPKVIIDLRLEVRVMFAPFPISSHTGSNNNQLSPHRPSHRRAPPLLFDLAAHNPISAAIDPITKIRRPDHRLPPFLPFSTSIRKNLAT